MKKIFILPSFDRSAERLAKTDKEQLAKGLRIFRDFVFDGVSSSGFRFKKLGGDRYEFRINIRLRALVQVKGGDFYLLLVGGHDEIKKQLKNN